MIKDIFLNLILLILEITKLIAFLCNFIFWGWD